MTTQEITNSDNVIDSRDVIARIDALQDERDNFEAGDDDSDDPADTSIARIARVQDAWATANPDEAAELAALVALQDEAEGYAPDWHHGATLINDAYFTEYAEDLVSDIGDLPRNIPGYLVIDWEATARNIQQDYTSVEFDGTTYWVR